MSITAKVHIKHDRLAFVPTVQNLDDVQIRVISQETTNPGATTFPFFVKYDDRERLEQAFDADPTVESYELVDWSNGAGIYYVEHTPDTELISSAVTEVNGYMVNTETEGKGWMVQLLLPDRIALKSIWEYADDHDITIDVVEIYNNDDVRGEISYGLTEEQRATLNVAYQNGYFSEPREFSLSDVADEMGLSSTATSGRLRRGMRNLISATIAENDVEE